MHTIYICCSKIFSALSMSNQNREICALICSRSESFEIYRNAQM